MIPDPITVLYDHVEVDSDGLAIYYHTADHHVAEGELTLCGEYIHYPTWIGTREGAPRCHTCEALDV